MQASHIEKNATTVAKKIRSAMAGEPKRSHTEAEKNACSLDAMLNNGTCEACQ
jgi:ribonucleoside-diphosphate reductase alpha chain